MRIRGARGQHRQEQTPELMNELSQRSTRLAAVNQELINTNAKLVKLTEELAAANLVIGELEGFTNALAVTIKDKPTLDALGIIKAKIKTHREKP